MNVAIRDNRMENVVAFGTELKRIGTGFLFTEGPLWHPEKKFLLFSDMPGNIIRRWDEKAGIQTFRQPSNMANGLAYDRHGRLLACEHATSRVVRLHADGSSTPIATHYDHKELNSPNDLVVKSDGSVYFSDPIFGRVEFYGVPREPDLDFRGVYRVSPEGELSLLVDDFAQPNGLCFTLDEKRMFINDTERGHVRVFDVAVDGTLRNGRIFAEVVGDEPGAPDGMKIDSEGNLFTCGPGGVHVFAPTGDCLGVIKVPEVCANFNWGGENLEVLFITASTSLYAIRVKVPGRRAF